MHPETANVKKLATALKVTGVSLENFTEEDIYVLDNRFGPAYYHFVREFQTFIGVLNQSLDISRGPQR